MDDAFSERMSGAAATPAARRIVLVHGLLHTDWWLRPLAARLRHEGFEPQLFGYPSVMGGPEQAVPRLVERLQASPVDAVLGHSLGGLIALQALRRAPDAAVRRVVCLGSPLRGSDTARRVAVHGWSRPLLGRSAGLLQEGLAGWDGDAAVGAVAGDVPRGVGRLFSRFEEDSDGTVSVDETRLPGLADHCIVHSTHTGLLFSRDAVGQAAHFLRHGRFEHAAEQSDV